ncbi:hypothetical protein [Moorena producens]|uniref:hypothetical protein n=1 Tax=Moorena producens TaxID=1155739 RepID=UPI000B2B9152|nr:hypothetical protein [Moorena producens]
MTTSISIGVADSEYVFAPLAPQFWGEQNYQAMQRGLGGFPHERLHQDKSPRIGGFRGL